MFEIEGGEYEALVSYSGHLYFYDDGEAELCDGDAGAPPTHHVHIAVEIQDDAIVSQQDLQLVGGRAAGIAREQLVIHWLESGA